MEWKGKWLKIAIHSVVAEANKSEPEVFDDATVD